MAKRECQGTRKDGKPCTATPNNGSDYCWRHVGSAASDTSDGLRASRTSAGACDWDRAAWLGAYEYTKMVSEACRMVGIARSTVYLERERNDEFRTAWDELNERVVESLEAEAHRRAVEGVERMVVSAGKRLGTEKQYSDSLLKFLLEANRPEKYRTRVDVAHSGGVKHEVNGRIDLSKLTDEQLDALDGIEDALRSGGEPPA